jgi:muramoyltetrapeptide carboxypeptidase
VIAPSGPFDPELFARGLGRLRERFTVQVDAGVHSRTGFLAGSDERRRNELERALRDQATRAIFIARGGHGLSRIVSQVDFAVLRAHPKWVVGFSDVTLLHLEAARVGVASLHAPNVTGIGRGDDAQWRTLCDHLAAPIQERRYEPLTAWQSGNAQGPLHGGNLSLLHSWAAGARLHIPDGAILFLEEVGEAPYRIDRMLTALLLARAFERVAGVVVGQLYDCAAGDYGVSAEEVVRERLAVLGVPVLYGLPCGHDLINVPLTLGGPARIEGGSLRVGAEL